MSAFYTILTEECVLVLPHSTSSENVRPYHMQGDGESDNDEFSFHRRTADRLRLIYRKQYNCTPVRNGVVKRTPEHHYEPSGSQLSDASALDVTTLELHLDLFCMVIG